MQVHRRAGREAQQAVTAQLILGIDPGLGGALALLTTAGELQVEDMPLSETERGGTWKRQADLRARAGTAERALHLSLASC
jgi:hypothetical protein